MNLICKECGNELVEGTRFCSNCGAKITEEKTTKIQDVTELETEKVEEISSTQEFIEEKESEEEGIEEPITENMPPSATKKILKLSNKKKIVISILIVILAIGGYVGYNKRQETHYLNKMKLVSIGIQTGAISSEMMISGYSTVWRNAIDSPYIPVNGKVPVNFNDAISLKHSEYNTNGDLKKLQDNKKEIDLMMKDLQNPPSKYKDAYDTLVQLYGLFNQFESLAESPSGSLISFNSKTSDLDTQLLSKINELNIKMPK